MSTATLTDDQVSSLALLGEYATAEYAEINAAYKAWTDAITKEFVAIVENDEKSTTPAPTSNWP